MKSFNRMVLLSTANSFLAQLNKKAFILIAAGFCLMFATSLFAASPVKPLSNKALKNIEEKYDKDTRKMFSGKGSEENVLALKRLIAEEVNPDVAIAAIRMYAEAKRYRSGSVQKRKAISELEALFASSNISGKKGRDIVMRAGTAIAARSARTEQSTYQNPRKPSCHAKKVVSKRAPKLSFQDPDMLAEDVLLTQLTGKTNNAASLALM